MTRHIPHVALALAVFTTAAAAQSKIPVAALQMLSAEEMHAEQLATSWKATHPNDTRHTLSNPEIISGKIVVASVNAAQPPSSPSIHFNFKTGPSGFNNAYFQFFSAATNQTVVLNFSASTARSSGGYTILTPGSVDPYAGAGMYTLDYAGIGDNAGGFTFYSNAELSSIFPNLNINIVNSGTPDTTVPSLTSGKIETPSVSLSSSKPLFLANLTVSDTISGVQGAFITFIDPNGRTYTAFSQAPSPITRSATLPVGFNIVANAGANAPTGTWTINTVSVQDVAGNSLEMANTQALFGTNTFQVVP